MERQWMTRAAPVRLRRSDALTLDTRVGLTDAQKASDYEQKAFADANRSWLGPNATKGAALGGALGTLGGLWFGFVRGGHAVGWPMLGWSILGSLALGGVGQAVGGLADVGVKTG